MRIQNDAHAPFPRLDSAAGVGVRPGLTRYRGLATLFSAFGDLARHELAGHRPFRGRTGGAPTSHNNISEEETSWLTTPTPEKPASTGSGCCCCPGSR
ncbi:hypothetical protein PT2222_90146 [Paraburkholderia tropica]